MKLPSGNLAYSSTPIYPGSNFTWGEATKNCTRQIQDLVIDGKLIVTAVQIEKNIVQTAMKMDVYREKLGNLPILVNSWYRPFAVNTRVRGSKYSRHQFGDGVDWKSNYFSPSRAAALLEPSHYDGGYHAYSNFTHTDWRGHKARW